MKDNGDLFKIFAAGGLYGLAIVWMLFGPIIQF